jgi:hypothetical protein
MVSYQSSQMVVDGNFSPLWTDAFRRLDIHGDDFLELGRSDAIAGKQFRDVICPQLKTLNARYGTGVPINEAERLRHSIRALRPGKFVQPALSPASSGQPAGISGTKGSLPRQIVRMCCFRRWIVAN